MGCIKSCFRFSWDVHSHNSSEETAATVTMINFIPSMENAIYAFSSAMESCECNITNYAETTSQESDEGTIKINFTIYLKKTF